MKIVRNISTICLALLAFSACDSDLDKVYYNEDNVTPAVLSGIADTYTLEANKAQSTAIEFNWTKSQAGYNAKITNSLQMDLKGKNFGNATVLYSSSDKGPYAITAKDLNSKIAKLLQSYGMEATVQPYEFEFRIASSISEAADSFYSNIESARITPFIGEPEYPKVYLPGAYCSWGDPDNSFKQCQLLYSPNDDGKYEGWIVFGKQAADGWKITSEASWDVTWGYDKVDVKNPATVTLTTDMDNIKCYNKFSYKFSFNKETLELSVKASVDTWGVCGSHNGWGTADDTPMTLAYESDASGNRTYYLTATLDLKAGNEWKIRADNDKGWANQFASDSVEGDFESGNDGNFKVSEDGTYTINIYFNKVKAQVVVTKK